LEDLANAAGLSAFHFARAFRAATGQSPLQYVIALRMTRAQVLLRSSQLPVAEIAYRVGYEDVSRFGQHFKRHTGATPGAFRAN
jgi:AraC family transcriptional regulator